MSERLGKLGHIGIAVDDLEQAKRLFGEVLGLRFSGEKELPDRGLRIAFYETGNTKIELLEGTDPESAVSKFLRKRGPGIHHLSFEVADIGRVLEDLAAGGVELIDRRPRAGAEGRSVAFLHPKSTQGVLIELEQEPE